jgi:hypothetical protein
MLSLSKRWELTVRARSTSKRREVRRRRYAINLAALVEVEEQRIGLTSRKSKILRAELRESLRVSGTLAATEDADGMVASGEIFGTGTKENANEPLTKKHAGLGFGAPPSPQPRYYVSYAWNDDTPEGKDREAIVDKRSDAFLSAYLWLADFKSWPAPDSMAGSDGSPDGRMDCKATYRGLRLGTDARIPGSRS